MGIGESLGTNIWGRTGYVGHLHLGYWWGVELGGFGLREDVGSGYGLHRVWCCGVGAGLFQTRLARVRCAEWNWIPFGREVSVWRLPSTSQSHGLPRSRRVEAGSRVGLQAGLRPGDIPTGASRSNPGPSASVVRGIRLGIRVPTLGIRTCSNKTTIISSFSLRYPSRYSTTSTSRMGSSHLFFYPWRPPGPVLVHSVGGYWIDFADRVSWDTFWCVLSVRGGHLGSYTNQTWKARMGGRAALDWSYLV